MSRARSKRRHIVLPEGTEERGLRAAEIMRLRDVVDLTLLGNPGEVAEKIAPLGLSLGGVRVVDPLASEWWEEFGKIYFEMRKHKGISPQMAHDAMADTSYFGTMMVHRGLADGMVSGAIHTTQHTIRPALEFVRTRPGVSIVSSVFLMCLPDRVLVYGYCAVEVLEQVTRESAIPMGRVAIGWPLGRKFVSAVIIGVRSVEQLNTNLENGDWDMPAEVWKALEERTRPEDQYLGWFNRKNYERFLAAAEFHSERLDLI